MSHRSAHPTVALIVKAIVTLVLISFAFLAPDVDAELRAAIVGLVGGYWLREGEGQALRNRRATDGLRGARRARGTGSTATTHQRDPETDPGGETAAGNHHPPDHQHKDRP